MKMLTSFFLLTFQLVAQPSQEILHTYMSKIRENPHTPVPQEILSEGENELALLDALSEYTRDTLKIVRIKAYDLVGRIGYQNKKPAIRKQAVQILIGGIYDDQRISGNVISDLGDFSKEDFDDKSKGSISKLVRKGVPYPGETIKLAGYLELDIIDELNALFIDASVNSQSRFYAQLALARLGNNTAINAISDKLTTMNVDDNFVYDLIPELVYTRQKQIFNYLVNIIQSNELNCYSANPNSERKILCGYRVMEYLAKAIVDYPLKVDEFGDLEIDNYQTALIRVREWFINNPDYRIKRDTF